MKNSILSVIFYPILFIPLINSSLFVDEFITPSRYTLFFTIALFCMFVLLELIKRGQQFSFCITLVDVFFLLWFCYSLIHGFVSHIFPISLDLNFLMIGIFWLLVKLKGDFLVEKEYKLIIIIMSVIALIECSIGLSQSFDLKENSWISGTFGNSGPYGVYLASLFPIVLSALLIKTITKYQKILLICVSIFILLMVFISHSRTSWISVLMVLFLFTTQQFNIINKLKKLLRRPLSKVIAAIGVIFLVSWSVYILFIFKVDSANGRIFIWERSLEIIQDYPVVGTGSDTFRQIYPSYQIRYFTEHSEDTAMGRLAGNTYHPFNEFLKVAVEFGLIGLLIFMLFILVIIKTAISMLRKDNQPMTIGILSGFCALVVSCLFSYPLEHPSTFFLFYFYSLLISIRGPALKTIIFPNRFKWIFILIGSLLIFSCWSEIHKVQAEMRWKNLTKSVSNNVDLDFRKNYEALYPVLKHNADFLYNYGAYLSLKGHYNDAIIMLQESKELCISTEVLNFIGNSYLGLGDNLKAERYFLQSSHLVPHKLYPKYQLVRVYAATDRKPDAIILASEIVNGDIKVSSYLTDQIQSEMKNFLSNEIK